MVSIKLVDFTYDVSDKTNVLSTNLTQSTTWQDVKTSLLVKCHEGKEIPDFILSRAINGFFVNFTEDELNSIVDYTAVIDNNETYKKVLFEIKEILWKYYYYLQYR